MRRVYHAVVFAGFVGLFATPISASPTADDVRETAASPAPVAVQRVAVPNGGMRDEAAMVLVGTMLIGLAAAVRRAA